MISDEISTAGAVDLNSLSWLTDETPYGTVQFQTRTGASTNSLDGTWESWKPVTAGTNTLSLETADTHTSWIPTETSRTDYAADSLGDGADGAITISADTDINANNSIGGRSCVDGGDAVGYNATALTADTATLSSAPSAGCLAAGDEVLLINVQGTNSAYGNTGNYETLEVQSVVSSTVTFTTSKTNYYGDGGSDDTNLGTAQGTQRVIVQRVPNYTTVTVDSGYNFYPAVWDGSKGGVMFFRATGAVAINGTIHANSKGYRSSGTVADQGGHYAGDGGEAFCGIGGLGGVNVMGTDGAAGGGGSYSTAYEGGDGYCGGGGGAAAAVGANNHDGSDSAGGAGGGGAGYGAGGGGAGYGTAGLGGGAGGGASYGGYDGGTNSSGDGGSYHTGYAGGGGGGTYGDANLDDLFFGSSGGEGGEHTSGTSGNGGAGGGIIYIAADSVTVSGALENTGATGANGGTYSGDGGAGAGGSIKILGNDVNLGTSKTTASGGDANVGYYVPYSQGGAGGVGRISVYYKDSIAGSSTPSYATDSTSDNYNSYKVLTSKELATTGAVSFSTIAWTQDLDTNGMIELQTRSGGTSDSTDDSWESWKPFTVSTHYVSINSMDTHTDWGSGSNVTPAETITGDNATRDINYFEDDDESTPANITKFTATAASGYTEDSITNTDLSDYDYITFWIRSSVGGSSVKVGMGEGGVGTQHEEEFKINNVNAWQKVYWDITDIASGDKDAINIFRFTIEPNGATVFVDSLLAERNLLETASGSTITSTANDYLQYRAILSTTSDLNTPTLGEVRVSYNDGAAQTIDDLLSNQNDADSYNPDLRLNITTKELDDDKSFRIKKQATSITSLAGIETGSGADGAITVSSDTDINANNSIGGRSCIDGGDAVGYNATALTSTTASLASAPSAGCLAAGDEVLLINVQGTTSAYGNTGNYETLHIEKIVDDVATFTTSKTNYYGDGGSDDTNLGTAQGTQRVIVQRVPNYTTVTVDSGYNFYPAEWDGSKGGVMFFRATGAVAINGTIHADAKGYRDAGIDDSGTWGGNGGEAFCGIGGTPATSGTEATDGAGGGGGGYLGGEGGDGYCGGGGGAADTSGSNTHLGSATAGGAGGGGGGYYAGGGGAGYGTPGTGGGNGAGYHGADGGTNSSGDGYAYQTAYAAGGGGGTYGDADLDDLFMGSAGGEGSEYTGAYSSGYGGEGGGIIYIAADSVTVSGALHSTGGDGTASGSVSAGGGGGAAGGSIKILGNDVNLGTSKTTAAGGAYGSSSSGYG